MNATYNNPAIGHWVTFLQKDEGLLQLEYGVQAHEANPAIPLHKHLVSEERFEVISGHLGIILNDKRGMLEPGQSVVIAPGTAHTFWNIGSEELRFLVAIRPPGRFHTYWETVFGLAEDGKVGADGMPNLLQLAVVAPYADSYDPRLPVPLSKLMITVLGGVGRLMGYKAQYPQYSRGIV